VDQFDAAKKGFSILFNELQGELFLKTKKYKSSRRRPLLLISMEDVVLTPQTQASMLTDYLMQ